MSKKSSSKKKAKDAAPRTKVEVADDGRDAKAAAAPPAPPVEKARWNLTWLAIGAAAFVVAMIPGLVVQLAQVELFWLVAVTTLVPFAIAGVGLGFFAKGKTLVQAGIAGLAVFLVATIILMIVLPLRLQYADNIKLDAFTYVVAGGTLAFDLSCLGAFIGASFKRGRREGVPDAWDEAGTWLAKHGALPALAHVVIVIACVHAHVFAGETVGDDLSFHFAESARLADCLRIGDFDFWNPSANGGYASAYYYQVVPQLASAIPAAIFGHHLFWFQLSVWLPHVLAPLAAYKGMRVLGATPWQSVAAAFALAFMNGQSRWGTGNAGTFQVGLYTQTWALAAFPLALGYGARWIADRRSLAPAIGWGGFVGLCHPFAAMVLGIGMFLGWLVRVVPHKELGWSRLPSRACLIVALVVMLILPKDLTDKISGLDMPSAALGAYVLASLFALTGLVLPFIDRSNRWTFPDSRAPWLELARLLILGVGYVIACLPVILPLLVDYDGFGAFPERVSDEIGPGFFELGRWLKDGQLLDFAANGRLAILTYSLTLVLLLGRDRILRWLWPGAFFYALFLGLGPHLGKIGADDLFPAVRVLGPLQIVLALSIGLCAVAIGRAAWEAPPGSRRGWIVRLLIIAAAVGLISYFLYALWTGGYAYDTKAAPGQYLYFSSALTTVHRLTGGLVERPFLLGVVGTVPLVALVLFGARPGWRMLSTVYGLRTALAAVAAALVVLVAVPGAKALAARVTVLADYPQSHRDEMMDINEQLLGLPQGRKQTAPGAENHWWNLLSYAYDRIPSLLQMGGGGLQASPNYHFLWWTTTQMHDYARNAWVYDAPYVVVAHAAANKLPPGDVVGMTKNYEIHKLASPGLVSPVQVVGVLPPGYRKGQPGRQAALDWIRGDKPLEDKVLAYDGFGGPGDVPEGKLIRAWHQDSPGDEPDIVAEIEADKPTTFVVRESWHPRWHAYLDGNEIAVRRVTPDFPAVDVPTGKHTLALRFERPWWAQAVWLLFPFVIVAGWLGARLVDGRGWPRPRLRLPRAFARLRPRAEPAAPEAPPPPTMPG